VKISEMIPEERWREVTDLTDKALGLLNMMGETMESPYVSWERLVETGKNERFSEFLMGETFDLMKTMLVMMSEDMAIPASFLVVSIAQKAYDMGRASMMPEFIVKED